MTVHENMPLVSIVLPVYNVGKYIDKCLSSIRNQIYTNWEAILIDDGSTDTSGIICEYHKSEDSRFIVVHQENSGVAIARRKGIDMANGKYITFIDPDDYVTPQYILCLLNLCRNNNVKISCCDYSSMESEISDGKKFNRTQILSKTDVINKMLYQNKMDCFLWGKMFDSEMLKHVNIPNVYLCEDLPAMCHALSLCDTKIAINDSKLYFYNKRQSGLTREEFNPKSLCMLDVVDIVENEISKMYPECRKSALCRKFSAYFHVYFSLPDDKELYITEKHRIEEFIKQNRGKIILDVGARKKAKIGAILSYFGFDFVRTVFNINK